MKEISIVEMKKINGGAKNDTVKTCNGWQTAAHMAGGFLVGATSLNPIGAAAGAVIGGVFCTPGH